MQLLTRIASILVFAVALFSLQVDARPGCGDSMDADDISIGELMRPCKLSNVSVAQ